MLTTFVSIVLGIQPREEKERKRQRRRKREWGRGTERVRRKEEERIN